MWFVRLNYNLIVQEEQSYVIQEPKSTTTNSKEKSEISRALCCDAGMDTGTRPNVPAKEQLSLFEYPDEIN